MADEQVVDKALAVAGATEETSDTTAIDTTGAPEPKAPSNEPPVEEKQDPPADPPKEEEEETEETEDEQQDEPALDTDKWGTTGDEVGDSVLALLQNADLTVDDAKSLMYDAMQAGDVTKIDKAALEAKVGKNKAALILAGAENFVARNAARTQSVIKEVHGTVGGEDNWNTIKTWANENLSADEIADYVELVNEGGRKARFAAQEMLAAYNASDKNTTLNTTQEVTPDAAAPQTTRSISKAAYFEELSKAHRTGAKPAVIAEIQQARQRGRAAGI